MRLSGAVLLLAYRRPEILKQTIASLEAADHVNISRFHIVHQVENFEVAKILESIDWAANLIQTTYSREVSPKEAINHNLFLGLEAAFSDSKIEYVVVLEDDICVSKDFFHFVFSVYHQNCSDRSFMAINGFSGIPRQITRKNHYGKYRYGVGWGWAIPRKTWENLLQIWNGNENEHWDGLIESFLKTGFTVAPGMSRIRNIGFGEGATHTNSANDLALLETQMKLEQSFVGELADSFEAEFQYVPADLLWREDCRVYQPTNSVRGRSIQSLYEAMDLLHRFVRRVSWSSRIVPKILSILSKIIHKLG